MYQIDYADEFGDFLNVVARTKAPTTEELSYASKLIAARSLCRKAEEWEWADAMRVKLTQIGCFLEDSQKGIVVVWKSIRKKK